MNNSVTQSIDWLNQKIKTSEYNIAKLQFVADRFPDVKIRKFTDNRKVDFFGFCSKTVNDEYTDFEFKTCSYSCYIKVFHELLFSHNGEEEVIKVYSSPETCRLAHSHYNYDTKNYEIVFSKFSFNMKKNNFDEKLLNDCRTEITKFIGMNPNVPINIKNIDPKLKKLLAFM